MSRTTVIKWSSPVPCFGDPSTSCLATLGLNPSNREFVDESGRELQGSFRRFHTLTSLGLSSWSDVDARHLRLIIETCRSYFLGNPYDRWFRRLDEVISGTKVSYYGASRGACHLDLIPYATSRKWTELTPRQRSALLRVATDTFGLLLRDSAVRILILNGTAVVHRFQDIAGVRLERREMRTWSLRRRSVPDVRGFAFTGVVDNLSGIPLGRQILVLGFNHNLQSSFGVTSRVLQTIRNWIGGAAREVL